ncbi:alkaline-phosphatase-like protein [Pilobolus umbonatus]|nr:alkaline-phosphatase-like protein [Pilobolus umbonatus]
MIGFRIIIITYGHDTDHTQRGAERLYFNGTEYFASTVILISLDGFRPDYLDRNITPNLQYLAADGIMAKYMHPSFPPSTFPNHWTLVTGLYPEAHGIVGNSFYDPSIKATFYHNNASITADNKWWKGEPIWMTSRINRKRSASVMWPGSETKHNSPDKVIEFNHSMTMREKMDITLNWIDLPYDDRPQIITVYAPQIDREGHDEGPEGVDVNKQLAEADYAIGYLMRGLVERDLDHHVHVIVVSDHGMTAVDESKLIYYDDIISKDLLEHLLPREVEPLLDMRPKKNAPKNIIDRIYEELHNYTQTTEHPHFKVYLRENVPHRYHYNNSDRITPIVTIPEIGYTFVTHEQIEKNGFPLKGNHGYDNLEEDMRAIFIARGPKIGRVYRPGTVLAPFFNTEVYGLLTELLNIDASPNNGTLMASFPVLYQPPF